MNAGASIARVGNTVAGCGRDGVRGRRGRRRPVSRGLLPFGRGCRGRSPPARVQGARLLVRNAKAERCCRHPIRAGLVRCPEAQSLGPVNGRIALGGGSNGGAKPPLQDERSGGGCMTAAHLASGSEAMFSPPFGTDVTNQSLAGEEGKHDRNLNCRICRFRKLCCRS